VVHLWIVPTEQELRMTSFITIDLVDTIADPTVELIKKELTGETDIRRAISQGQPNVEDIHDQPTAIDLGASTGGVVGGVFATDASRDDEHIGAQENINTFEITPYTCPSRSYTGLSHPCSGPSHPSSPLFSHYKCNVCNDRQDKLLENLEAITKTIEELRSKRVVIPSKKVRDPYTPTVAVRRKKRKISQRMATKNGRNCEILRIPRRKK
ncbi:hypothetical protein FXO37_34826, partial [Capsicum annuum]